MFRIILACIRLAPAALIVASVLLPQAAHMAQAAPKVRESATNDYLKIDGRTFTVTVDRDSKDEKNGLVILPEFHQTASFYNEDKWIRVLKPVYHSVMAANNRLFVKREPRFDANYYEIVLKKNGNKYSVVKEVPTPYTSIKSVSAKVLLGQKYIKRQFVPSFNSESGYEYEAMIYKTDILNENGAVTATLNNVGGEVTLLSDQVLAVPLIDDQSQRLIALTDLSGNLVAPLLPNPVFGKSRTSNGTEKRLIAVPLDGERKYWMPMRGDGTTPLDPQPIKGYISEWSKLESGNEIRYWLKEYETPAGPVFGWASPNLSQETGPRWKSINWVRKHFPMTGDYWIYQNEHSFLVGQLLDGKWMGYETARVYDDNGYGITVFEPLHPTPLASQEEVVKAVAPIFVDRGNRSMAKTQQQLREYTAWKEQMKKDSGCDAGQDLDSEACASRRKTIREYNEAIETKSYESAYTAARALGGDYFVKFMLFASQRKIYNVEPATLFNLASSAKDTALAAQVRKHYDDLLTERKRAAEAAKLAASAPKPAVTTSSYQSSWSGSSWAVSNSWTLPGPSHQQSLDNYIRDYRTWINGASTYKPTSPF